MPNLDDVLKFIDSNSGKKQYEFSYKGYEETLHLFPGFYSFELWGAAGCDFISSSNRKMAGNGSYVFGKIRLEAPKNLFIYVGPKGQYGLSSPPFGGGGFSDMNGGGSSDVRLIGSNSFESLKSRIIVASGGGGADSLEEGGSGGALIGINSKGGYSKGATQTDPGTGAKYGEFGKGGGDRSELDNNGAGGGGYYGGGSGKIQGNYGGSGGSSFISGHPGCNAVYENSTKDEIYHTGQPFHYSGLVFYDTFMAAGNSTMPGITTRTQTGNHNNGYIRITLFSRKGISILSCRTNRLSLSRILAAICILYSS